MFWSVLRVGDDDCLLLLECARRCDEEYNEECEDEEAHRDVGAGAAFEGEETVSELNSLE